ncbi:carboxyl-terminal protease [Flavobacteriaceae bacterium XHP0103]|uniref:S41 family peptidase n=1 Tax=Marixanthotalea marina TaxID=2844359 RepID=UPI002989C2FD|nr:S41 family peptidase [Marixanthotalea marina]MBU3821701.1 carboxyl-terminal protease [Marixanthotalea marina]
MNFLKPLIFTTIISFLCISCFKDSDDTVISTNSINDFVWKGMNYIYLYKDDIQKLSDDEFGINAINNRYDIPVNYGEYLNSYSNPEDFFESLIYQRETVDRFSWIVDDYIALEQQFAGTSTSDGMEVKLFSQPNSSNLMGIIRLVLPNSSANMAGLKRGDIFNAINGTPITTANYLELLNLNAYTLDLATYNDNGTPETTDDTVDSTGESVNLTKTEYTENPIFKTDIFNVNGENVGYLMYNGFTANFDEQLNNAFATFKSNNVQDLILDLRYNPGGSVNSAILLASMITGQFNGEVFSTEQWNSDNQVLLENNDPESLINRFTDKDGTVLLNSLNLQKVYIIALETSASASELVINCLDPYINVVHIGENTAGKYQASTTLYDSPDFKRAGANLAHNYAMQPLIFKSLNKNGRTDYFDGLTPDIELSESYLNLGVLGDENEKLLAAALADIGNTTTKAASEKPEKEASLRPFKDSNSFKPFNDIMYVDKKLPLKPN